MNAAAGEKKRPFVIGAGFGRTGTLSLKAALEKLGYGPCHHMSELFKTPGQLDIWYDHVSGKRSELDLARVIVTGPKGQQYKSTTDFPLAGYYKDLLKLRPDAVVVLGIRDPEKWFESFQTLMRTVRIVRYLGFFFSFFHKAHQVAMKSVNNKYPDLAPSGWGANLDKGKAIAAFERHNAEARELYASPAKAYAEVTLLSQVKAFVPAKKLLVFEVKSGWAPLCAFLGEPIPSEPFPHLNESGSIGKTLRTTAIKMVMGLFGFGGKKSAQEVMSESIDTPHEKAIGS